MRFKRSEVSTFVLEPQDHKAFQLIESELRLCSGYPTPGQDLAIVVVDIVNRACRPALGAERTLLTLNWQYKASIEYDAGFDTDEIVYGEELYVYEKNPENAWVSINWRESKPEYRQPTRPDKALG